MLYKGIWRFVHPRQLILPTGEARGKFYLERMNKSSYYSHKKCNTCFIMPNCYLTNSWVNFNRCARVIVLGNRAKSTHHFTNLWPQAQLNWPHWPNQKVILIARVILLGNLAEYYHVRDMLEVNQNSKYSTENKWGIIIKFGIKTWRSWVYVVLSTDLIFCAPVRVSNSAQI